MGITPESGGGATNEGALTRARIVHTAMALADGQGAHGLTMRRLAAALGSAPMSLYRHITNKDELLDLLLDAVFAEIPLPENPAHSWRDGLSRLAVATREVIKRHPWVRPLLNERPTFGPNYLRWFECSLATLSEQGLEMATMMQMVGAVNAYVMGVISYEIAEAENAARTGLDDAQKHELAAPYVAELIAGGELPLFARWFETPGVLDAEQGFHFGLGCLLDGIAARIAQAKASGR